MMLPGTLTDHEKALCATVMKEWAQRGALAFRISHTPVIGVSNTMSILFGLGLVVGVILLRSAHNINLLGILILLAGAVACVWGAVANTRKRWTASRTGMVTLLSEHILYEVEDRQGKKEQVSLKWPNLQCSVSDEILTLWELGAGSFTVPIHRVADYSRLRAALISRIGLTEEQLVVIPS